MGLGIAVVEGRDRHIHVRVCGVIPMSGWRNNMPSYVQMVTLVRMDD